MRELAKSAFSFSWALSLLSLEQVVNLVRPGQKPKDDVFDPITQAAVNQLDDSLKDMYRFGDNVQKRMVDAAFWWLSPDALTNISKWFSPRTETEDKPSQETGEATQAAQGSDQQQAAADESCCA